MSKDKVYNRLEELFSNIDAVDPEPVSAHLPEPAAVPENGSGSNGSSQPAAKAARNGRFTRAHANWDSSVGGWAEFLDGVHRSEHLGYLFDNQEVNPLVEPLSAAYAGPESLTVPIAVVDAPIGQLRLDSSPDQSWKAEDVELVNTVVQQLAQQLETLRLLDEAKRSREDAEEAFRRLARQGGRTKAEEEAILSGLNSFQGWTEGIYSTGLVFDGCEVLPVKELPSAQTGLQTPIRAGEALVGHFQIEMPEAKLVDQEDSDLVDTIAQRLAQQVENLRLLEESRHYRSEAEQAIRRLTYQSWQSYLETARMANMGYAYHLEQKVVPLDTDAPISGPEIPLRVREEVIGHLAAEIPDSEQEDAADLMRVIADRLSNHLEGLRLAEQREQALSETELLYSISARLSTAQSFEDALTSVSQPAHESGASDSRLFFVTLDERGQPESLTLAAVWYPDEGSQLIPVNAQFMLVDYPAYWESLSDPQNPTLVEDIEQDVNMGEDARELIRKTGARAVAVLPLAVSGRWVGVIFINWEQPHKFSDQERRFYTTLSRQAAVVVNNRLLLEQTRKRAQELQTVAQVSTAASTTLDPQELLQSVVDLTKSSFSLYHAQVYLYRPVEHILEVAASAGESKRQQESGSQYVTWSSSSPVARCARDRQVIILNDTHLDPDYTAEAAVPDVRSEMAIPMVVGDRLMGVFNVQSNQVNRFTREDARTYNTLASQVAVALQNAELYAEQSATVERLRELDHLKSSFLANMSHELRTPLNSILGFAEVLLLELDGPLNDIMTNDIKLIEKNGKHLLSLINDVLDMAKIEAGRMNLAFERFPLGELLTEAIDITSSLAREKALSLTITPDSEDSLELTADRVRMRQVLINIISNAVKFTEKGGIAIRAVQHGNFVRINVQDTGIGVPQDKLEMIFEAFSQVDTSTTRKVGGTGLGLPISRRLVEMHGGHLWAESEGAAGKGSLFIVELPLEAVKPN